MNNYIGNNIIAIALGSCNLMHMHRKKQIIIKDVSVYCAALIFGLCKPMPAIGMGTRDLLRLFMVLLLAPYGHGVHSH